MSTISSGPYSSYVQQAFASAIQSSGLGSGSSSAASSAASSTSDSSQVSGFAKIAVALQQLQESDPAKYKQVTAAIAANLSSAAQTATSQGNAAAAKELTQLANDFNTASQTGQLPNFQDLLHAAGGGHGGRHHHHHVDSDSDSPASASSTSTASAATSASSASSSANTLNAASIIESTLANSGVSTSGS